MDDHKDSHKKNFNIRVRGHEEHEHRDEGHEHKTTIRTHERIGDSHNVEIKHDHSGDSHVISPRRSWGHEDSHKQ